MLKHFKTEAIVMLVFPLVVLLVGFAFLVVTWWRQHH